MNNTITGYFSPKTKNKRRRNINSPESVEESGKKVKGDDMGEVGNLSITQLREIMQDLMKDVAKKEDINSINGRIDAVVKENEFLKEEINCQKVINNRLVKQVEHITQELNKNKAIFYGIKTSKYDEYEAIVHGLCRDVLKINEDLNIVSVIPMGAPNKDSRPIKVEFCSVREVNLIMKKAKLFKGTSYSVQYDLTLKQRQAKGKLLFIRKKLKELNSQHSFTVWRNYLIVNSHRLSWDDEKGLLLGKKDGKKLLEELFNFDFSEIITKLLNEGPISSQAAGNNSSEEGA